MHNAKPTKTELGESAGFETMEAAQQAINKGDKVQLLLEIIMTELGIDDYSQIFNEIRKAHEDYEKAIKIVQAAIQVHHMAKGHTISDLKAATDGSVSVSNN